MENLKKKMQKKVKFNKTAIIRIVLFLTLIIATIYIISYYYNSHKNKKMYKDIGDDIATEKISKVNSAFMEKVKELKQENSDIKGWIRIEKTNINYPLVQAADNDYYVSRNYLKENSKYGSIFINCNSDLKDVNSNVIIYRP